MKWGCLVCVKRDQNTLGVDLNLDGTISYNLFPRTGAFFSVSDDNWQQLTEDEWKDVESTLAAMIEALSLDLNEPGARSELERLRHLKALAAMRSIWASDLQIDWLERR